MHSVSSRAPFRSFLSSQPFLVHGPGGQVFYAHGELLAQRSGVLAAAINGVMREAKTKSIEIKDVDNDIDDDTVMLFIEYAYSNDYQVPEADISQLQIDTEAEPERAATECGPKSMTELLPEPSPEPEVEIFGWNPKSKKKRKIKIKTNSWYMRAAEPAVEEERIEEAVPVPDYPFRSPSPVGHAPCVSPDATKVSRQQLWDEFRSQEHITPQKVWEPPSNNQEHEDFSGIFLCHARLYKFSERYACEDLMNLALQKLRLTMSTYIFYQERAHDVVKLIQYVYKHTIEYEKGLDRLREMILQYAVCHVKQLMKEPTFLKLLNPAPEIDDMAGTSLSKDLLMKIMDMID